MQAKTWYFVTIYYELKVVSLDWEICFKISQNIIFSGKMEWGMLSNFSDIDRSIMPKYTACVNFVFVDFLTLIYRSSVSNFTSFHKVDRDLQKYRHLQMALTYDVIGVSPHGVLYTTWSQKLFSAKREKLISVPVKFEVHIISKSTFF